MVQPERRVTPHAPVRRFGWAFAVAVHRFMSRVVTSLGSLRMMSCLLFCSHRRTGERSGQLTIPAGSSDGFYLPLRHKGVYSLL